MSGDEVLEFIAPDDFHHHFRQGDQLTAIVPLVARQFKRAIAMPNTTPPITTAQQAIDYRNAILAESKEIEPLMTIYLTDNTSAEELKKAKDTGVVLGCKLYPAGATTNSENGVTRIENVFPALAAMEKLDLVLLVHGEVFRTVENGIAVEVDIFDREKRFMEDVVPKIVGNFPRLRLVLEHITTKDAVDYVLNAPREMRLGATITPQHLLFHRNKLFEGNFVRPHMFCMPILKAKNPHHDAMQSLLRKLCDLETNKLTDFQKERFFLGTDSAAHPVMNKLDKGGQNCGCAGVFSATNALEFYALAFENACGGKVHVTAFESFCSRNGAGFYGLPINSVKVKLLRKESKVPEKVVFNTKGEKDYFVPMLAGETIDWTFVENKI